VSADPGRLGVAIDAVVENAVQHTAAGDRILLRARSDRRGARIEVADSGPGIPPEALGPIFNRFSRAPGVRRGTGLGLPMTRAIMEAHGGSAHVESADGRGTTVALSLPTAG
jgi:signal transduction histidine kinase